LIDERFEYPLPLLYVSAEELIIETKDRFESGFKIKNTGGGLLSGRIYSRTRSVAFEPSAWEGNEAEIRYCFTPDTADGWKPGDVVETCAVVCSNGGEKKLPIIIRLTKMAITTDENVTIVNLRDFYAYASQYPAQARKLFVDNEFYMLLLAIGYEYLEAYEILHKDLNRERALDNFFILSGLKTKTTLTVPKRIIEFSKPISDSQMLYGNFIVQKSDAGYLETPVIPKYRVPWLGIDHERLITSDFNEACAAMVKFSIDPLRVQGRYACEMLTIGAVPEPDGSNCVELIFRRLAPVTVRAAREAYRYDDEGFLEILNHTGTDLVIEVFCEDAYIRFAARRYPVGERLEIPFTVKLSAFMTAQLMFRKLPFLRTAIEVRTFWRDTVVRKKLPLTVGEW
jgi:hypothetical protein